MANRFLKIEPKMLGTFNLTYYNWHATGSVSLFFYFQFPSLTCWCSRLKSKSRRCLSLKSNDVEKQRERECIAPDVITRDRVSKLCNCWAANERCSSRAGRMCMYARPWRHDPLSSRPALRHGSARAVASDQSSSSASSKWQTVCVREMQWVM